MTTLPHNRLVGNPQPVNSVFWPGKTGRKYQFELWPVGTRFFGVPGVYIMCKPDRGGALWNAAYIGEADNLNDRVGDGLGLHEKWESCRTWGATHVCVLVVRGSRSERLAIERDLRHGCLTFCNDQ